MLVLFLPCILDTRIWAKNILLRIERPGEIHRITQSSFSCINLGGLDLLANIIINSHPLAESINNLCGFDPTPHFEIVYCSVWKGVYKFHLNLKEVQHWVVLVSFHDFTLLITPYNFFKCSKILNKFFYRKKMFILYYIHYLRLVNIYILKKVTYGNSDFPIIKDNLCSLCFCESELSKNIPNILKDILC